MEKRINVSDIYSLYDAPKCERKLYLRINRVTKADFSRFDRHNKIQSKQHELEHLLMFDNYVDLSGWNFEDRVRKTIRAIVEGVPIIYQGAFIVNLPSKSVEIIGTPDLLIKDNGSYSIRECCLSRNVDPKHLTGITYQLELYGWLFENTFGTKPSKLEIYFGDKTLKEIPYRRGDLILGDLATIISLLEMEKGRNNQSLNPRSSFIDHCLQKAGEVFE